MRRLKLFRKKYETPTCETSTCLVDVSQVAYVVKDGKKGLVDYAGNEVVPCEYDKYFYPWRSIYFGPAPRDDDNSGIRPAEKYREYSEGLAEVYVGEWLTNAKYGFVDAAGNVVVDFRYERAYPFSDGLALVCLKGRWGFINHSGEEVIPCQYVEASPFSEGLAAVVNEEHLLGFIDRKGAEVIPFIYSGKRLSISDHMFADGVALVMLDGRWGAIDKAGKEVLPFRFDQLETFLPGLIQARCGDKWAFYDTSGHEAFPQRFDDIDVFTGVLIAKNWDEPTLWLILPGAKEPVRSCYSKIFLTNNDEFIFVVKDGRYGVLDNDWKEILPCLYDEIKDLGEDSNRLAVCQDGKWGVFDIERKEILPCRYEGIKDLGDDSNRLAVCQDGKWGVFDIERKEILPCRYEGIKDLGDDSNRLAVCQDGLWGIFDMEGNQITPFLYWEVEDYFEVDDAHRQELQEFVREYQYSFWKKYWYGLD